MKRRRCRREAKRTLTSPWAEGSLHRAKPCFIFHAPQVRFISKQKSTALAVLFCLAVMVLKDACLLGQESIPIRNTFVFFLQSFKSLFFSVVTSSIIILPLSPILAPHRFSPKESQESWSGRRLMYDYKSALSSRTVWWLPQSEGQIFLIAIFKAW